MGLVPPPPGVIPNFVNPESVYGRVMTAELITLGFALPFVLMRIYTRFFITRAVGWDDFFAVCATGLSITYTIASSQDLKDRAFHAWDTKRSSFNRNRTYRWSVIGYAAYMVAMGAVKLSILLLYLRIFSMARKLKIVIYLIIAFVVGYVVSGELSFLLRCKPIKKIIRSEIPGTCLNLQIHIICQAVFNFVSDVMIVVAPIPTVWALRLQLKRKLAVIACFATGFSVCAFSAIRLSLVADMKNRDFTWLKSLGDMWSLVELNAAIVCTCLPALRTFMSHITPRIRRLFIIRRSPAPSQSSNPVANNNNHNNNNGNNGIHNRPEKNPCNRVRSMHVDEAGNEDIQILELGENGKNKVCVTTGPATRSLDSSEEGNGPRRNVASFEGEGIMRTVGVKVK
ncbi:MAG: hypothetical protein M1823_004691 [Watsoniomyces obsoletus]|nr:MAG: hypothetical protein M1823_004691 [Watsoniomyces obsoletus]